MHLRLISDDILVCVCVLLKDEAVASINWSASAGVNYIYLIAAVRLGHAVWHVDAATPTQSLVALAPAKPPPGLRLNQGKDRQRQTGCQQQGNGHSSWGVL